MKNMKCNYLYENLFETHNLLKKKLLLLSLSSVLDLVFLFLYFIISSFFFNGILPIVSRISEILADNPALLSGGLGSEAPFAVPIDAFLEFKGLFWDVIKILIVYILVLFAILLIFQATNWFLANKFSTKKIKFWNFFKKFSALLGVYFGFALLIAFISFKLSFSTLFNQELFINLFLIIGMSILTYLAIISFSFIHKYKFKENFKNTFNYGYKAGVSSIGVVLIFLLLKFLLKGVLLGSVFFGAFNSFFLLLISSATIFFATYKSNIKFLKESFEKALPFISLALIFVLVNLILTVISPLFIGKIGFILRIIVSAVILMPVITFSRVHLIKKINKK